MNFLFFCVDCLRLQTHTLARILDFNEPGLELLLVRQGLFQLQPQPTALFL